jgi:hypothetical protein
MLKLFNNYIQKIGGEKMSAFKLIDILNSLLNNLKNIKNEHFINTEMEIMIDFIEEESYLIKKEFDINCQKFYDLCISYIQK